MLKAEIRRELDRIALVTTQLAAVERARDALIRTDAEERNNPAALLLKLKGLGPEFASLLWLESLFRSFGNRRQVAAYGGLAPSPWQSGGVERDQGISKSGNRRLRKTMIELAWFWLRHQPDTALSRWFHTRVGAAKGRDPPDRHRRAGPQTPRRLVALCHPRRRSRGRRVQGGMTIDDLTPFQRSRTRRLRRIRAGGDRGSTPWAETRRQKGWSRQPEPDTLEHEGLWSEPTSSTGCEVMRSSGLHGKDGLTLRIQTPKEHAQMPK